MYSLCHVTVCVGTGKDLAPHERSPDLRPYDDPLSLFEDMVKLNVYEYVLARRPPAASAVRCNDAPACAAGVAFPLFSPAIALFGGVWSSRVCRVVHRHYGEQCAFWLPYHPHRSCATLSGSSCVCSHAHQCVCVCAHNPDTIAARRVRAE